MGHLRLHHRRRTDCYLRQGAMEISKLDFGYRRLLHWIHLTPIPILLPRPTLVPTFQRSFLQHFPPDGKLLGRLHWRGGVWIHYSLSVPDSFCRCYSGYACILLDREHNGRG